MTSNVTPTHEHTQQEGIAVFYVGLVEHGN